MGDNTLKSGIPNFNINDTMGFYQSNDNSGNSYYFRGAVTNNYVSFADLIWRVVRINGDNSIRLVLNDFIYNGDTSHCRFVYSDSHSALGKGADFFVGYTFNNPHTCTNNNPCTDKDGTASTMKKTLESWYSNNLQDYDKYIATSYFCNDTYLVNIVSTIPPADFHLQYVAENVKLYKATSIFNSDYSRIMSGTYWPNQNYIDNISSSNLVNYTCTDTNQNYGGVYKLKIGLLTAQEIIMAGVGDDNNSNNNLSYLYRGLKDYVLTMTPLLSATNVTCSGGGNCITDLIMIAIRDGYDGYTDRKPWYASDYAHVKPVINLDQDVVWSGNKGEDGTENHPYTIALE